ncbi:hypothetical protein, partial [Streptomyces sp. NPDC127040]
GPATGPSGGRACLRRSPAADTVGAPLVTAGLMPGVFTVFEVERYGWTAGRTLGLGGLWPSSC